MVWAQIQSVDVRISNLIRSDWISDEAIVIDAGYHRGGIRDVHPEGQWADAQR